MLMLNNNWSLSVVGLVCLFAASSRASVLNSLGANGLSANEQLELDLEEDPRDRFVTSRSGKLRPKLLDDDEQNWRDDVPVTLRHLDLPSLNGGQELERHKRCGDDDDGDANRARRARRVRARRARRAAKRAARREAKRAAKAAASSSSTTTTTVTRKVIQNGQVVSQTTETQGGQQQVVQSAAPVVVQHQQPATSVVQTVPAATVPAQQVVQQQQPGTVPSIAVQGSIKIN